MKILVVGPSGCDQGQVLKSLGINADLPECPQGICLEHNFSSKYFEQVVGIWVDEFEDWAEWSTNFASAEAKEVRQALLMVILCLPRGSLEHLSYLEPFITALRKERPGVVVAGVSETEIASQVQESVYQQGIDLMESGELLDSVYSALIDWDGDVSKDQGQPGPFEEPEALMEPLMDLESMVERLKVARDGEMSDQERRALAEQLARELVP